ncbi:MAG: hypothetical protein LQ340_003419 [Diploschistes diacapsis]|nr:MAG: hypothetical protein LQ340_003419 [Diploschistes diacapsis]
MASIRSLGYVIPRVKSSIAVQLRSSACRRWVQISTTPAVDVPQLDQLPLTAQTELDVEVSDAKFEVLGAPYSLLAASLSASQPLHTRRGTLVGVVSNLSLLEPFRRAIFGIPFLYQKINSASPITALIATKSPLTSFTTIYLDGTSDWMIAQRDALLAWTGQSLSLSPRINASLIKGIAHWGNTNVTGRGLLALTGKGQIYQVTVKAEEQYVVHPSNVLAYTVTKHPPLPYRFKSTALRLEVPGLGGLWRLLPDIKFFRNMRESSSWRFAATVLFALRTWSRRTIWGDRLFLQFQGPSTILLQTRASRISDVLTSRDVNEIADTEPGAVQSATALRPEAPQPAKQGNQDAPQAPAPTTMTYASVSKGGDFLLEQTARKSDNKHLSKLREMASSQTNTSRDGVGALDPEKGDVTRPQLSALGHLQRTFSRVSTDDIGPPPDGGLPAWSQVVLCHISTINTWGLLHMMSGA